MSSTVLVDPTWLFEATIKAQLAIEEYRKNKINDVKAQLILENKKRFFGLFKDRTDEEALSHALSDTWEDRLWFATYAFDKDYEEVISLSMAASKAIDNWDDSIVKEIVVSVATFNMIMSWCSDYE